MVFVRSLQNLCFLIERIKTLGKDSQNEKNKRKTSRTFACPFVLAFGISFECRSKRNNRANANDVLKLGKHNIIMSEASNITS